MTAHCPVLQTASAAPSQPAAIHKHSAIDPFAPSNPLLTSQVVRNYTGFALDYAKCYYSPLSLKTLPLQRFLKSSFLLQKLLSCKFTELLQELKQVLSKRFGWRLKVYFGFH